MQTSSRTWTVLGAGLLLLAGCGSAEKTAHSDRVKSLVLRSQVALMQAADNARADYEADRQEEALAAIANAKGEDGYVEPPNKGPPQRVTLGSRYEVRPDATGYSVYDMTTGATASEEHGALRGLDQDDAEQAVVRLNGRQESSDQSDRVTFDGR